MKTIGTCKECKYYKNNSCRCDKFRERKEAMKRDKYKKSDMLFYYGWYDYHLTPNHDGLIFGTSAFWVGENFGCINWEKKDGGDLDD